MIDSFEFNALPDSALLRWLAAEGPRPNILIDCSAATAEAAGRHLMTWCSLLSYRCTLPGPLELSRALRGTLLLQDVAGLTLPQQVTLFDWLSSGSRPQLVSLTAEPLTKLVADGKFLEGLFRRLSVIRLDATQGTRPKPLHGYVVAPSVRTLRSSGVSVGQGQHLAVPVARSSKVPRS